MVILENWYTVGPERYVFFEYCNGGDLQRFLDCKKGRITEAEKKLILTKLLQIFRELHENGVIFRDLKPANLLLHFPGNAQLNKSEAILPDFIKETDLTEIEFEMKICDFGLARKDVV